MTSWVVQENKCLNISVQFNIRFGKNHHKINFG